MATRRSSSKNARNSNDGGRGHDSVSGGTGNDEIFGAADDNGLAGGDGDDILHGNRGDDALLGAPGGLLGHDRIHGFRSGQDTLQVFDNLTVLSVEEGRFTRMPLTDEAALTVGTVDALEDIQLIGSAARDTGSDLPG